VLDVPPVPVLPPVIEVPPVFCTPPVLDVPPVPGTLASWIATGPLSPSPQLANIGNKPNMPANPKNNLVLVRAIDG
jgi:hypothetical protein